jgi:hypothetical protein
MVATATLVAALIAFAGRTTWDPKYSVAVAAVAGVDPVRDLSERGRPALSPVLNVTFHIDNTRSLEDRDCVRDLSSATVTYGDAFLGKGTVPPFCARPREVAEGVARAWGEDVVVPWFLRDQLAGELAGGRGDGGRSAAHAQAQADVNLQGQDRRGSFSVQDAGVT